MWVVVQFYSVLNLVLWFICMVIIILQDMFLLCMLVLLMFSIQVVGLFVVGVVGQMMWCVVLFLNSECQQWLSLVLILVLEMVGWILCSRLWQWLVSVVLWDVLVVLVSDVSMSWCSMMLLLRCQMWMMWWLGGMVVKCVFSMVLLFLMVWVQFFFWCVCLGLGVGCRFSVSGCGGVLFRLMVMCRLLVLCVLSVGSRCRFRCSLLLCGRLMLYFSCMLLVIVVVGWFWGSVVMVLRLGLRWGMVVQCNLWLLIV